MSNIGSILKAFSDKLTARVENQGSVTQFEEGDQEYVWRPGGAPEKFTFSPEIRAKVVESANKAVEYVLTQIWPHYKPASRKGKGTDGGQRREPGQPFDLD
jgi:hypothetical protein